MGYPNGVPYWCTYWGTLILQYLDKFLKHFNIIFHLLSCEGMEQGWSFVKKIDRGRASFSRYWHLKFTPEKPNSYITISVSKLQVLCCSPYRGRTFPHSYALLRSLGFAKTHVKLTIFFAAENIKFDTKITQILKVHQKWTGGHIGQFSKFCLRQQLFAFKEFRMKTRLHNISKTTNATNFTKTILESS